MPTTNAGKDETDYVPLCDNPKEPPALCFRDHLRNPIISRTLVSVLFINMASALWAGTAIVAFIFVLTDSNSRVGFIEAAQGLANLLVAFPVGYMADKWSKTGIVRIGAIMNILNVGLLAWAVFRAADSSNSSAVYFALVAAMSVQGTVDAITNGPLLAHYADALPTGTRAAAFTYKFVLTQTGSALGPLVTIIIFQTCGDTWTLPELRDVILVGLGLAVLGALCMLTVPDAPDTPQREHVDGRQVAEQAESCDLTDSERTRCEEKPKSTIDKRGVVPATIFCANILSALGAGMTVKFFPLWFKNDVGLSPTGVQSIYLLNPLGMIVASQIGRRTARWIGRIQTMLLFRVLGLSCLLALILMQHVTVTWSVVVPIYLLRTVLMNSAFPLQESLIMDFVPRESRARWKSLSSIGKFGWCGSAALGGLVLDRYDYSTTFAFTLALQGLATTLLIPLLWIVPVREADAEEQSGEGPPEASRQGAGGAASSEGLDPLECHEPGCVVCQLLSGGTLIRAAEPSPWCQPIQHRVRGGLAASKDIASEPEPECQQGEGRPARETGSSLSESKIGADKA